MEGEIILCILCLQILSELFLLCLCDPRDVLSTAVKMSISNKDQAKNFAQVLYSTVRLQFSVIIQDISTL